MEIVEEVTIQSQQAMLLPRVTLISNEYTGEKESVFVEVVVN